ncbi:MAG: ATP-binding protein [Acidobacteriota bacterium]
MLRNRLLTRLVIGAATITILTVVSTAVLPAMNGWLLAGVSLALLMPAVIWWARRAAGSVEEMVAVATSLAEGGDALCERDDRTDELGDLARALNRIRARVAHRVAEARGEDHRMQTILAGMVEGVVATDRDERVVHINEAAARILEVEVDTAAGRPIWEITRVVAVSEVLQAARQELAVIEREVRLVPGSGERVVSLHAAPLREDAGVSGAVVVLHDITELRRLEAVRREFVANVSHELRTPLTAIAGLVETLIDDPDMEARTRQRFLSRISAQGRRLNDMVRDLLDLSRIESAAGTVEMSPTDLGAVVRAGIEVVLAATRGDRPDVDVVLPESPVIVRGDDDSLQRAVANLVENAIRYTDRGGTVRVAVKATSDRAELTVADTGIGIEAAHRERIFERFYRVDRSRSRRGGGTGLGLAIVKHVAVTHGGTVEMESEPGRGSTFRITLPLAESASRARTR